MCGIVGILDFDAPVSPYLIHIMADSIAHRGPDGEGYYYETHIGLGYRRLAIVDVKNGIQPVKNEAHTIHAIFNGEIYNHIELRSGLAKRGHCFISNSDAEVIPHLYEELGLSFVDELDGDFAIAIWDAKCQTLILARDRVGVKPLFYHIRGRRLIFASEIKGIFASELCEITIDPQGLSDCFFYGQTVSPGTFWSDIQDQLPGTVLCMTPNGLSEKRYFTALQRQDLSRPLLHGPEAIKAFAHTFSNAVRKRLPDEVKAGALLSGGIDSTAVEAVAAKLCGNPLPTYSILLPGEIFDESSFSRYAAQELAVENTEVPLRAQDVCSLLPETLWHLEAPQWFGVAPPFLVLSKMASEAGVKVALTGDGADELLGGYDFYRVLEMNRWFTSLGLASLQSPIWKRASRWVGTPDGLIQHMIDVHSKEAVFRSQFGEMPAWIYVWSGMHATANPLFNSYPLPSPSPLPLPPNHDLYRRRLHFEYVTRLPNWVLVLSDRLSMANGIEVRVPFMDRALLDLCNELSPNLLLRRGEVKYVLKQALRHVLPPRIRQRPKKPFFTPVTSWYLSGAGLQMARHYLATSTVKQIGIFDPRAVLEIWNRAISKVGTWEGMLAEWAIMMIMSTHILVEQFPQRLRM